MDTNRSKKFSQKPIEVEAMQLTVGNFWEVFRWIESRPDAHVHSWRDSPDEHFIVVRTDRLESPRQLNLGSWAVYYPSFGSTHIYWPDAFADCFDPVSEPAIAATANFPFGPDGDYR